MKKEEVCIVLAGQAGQGIQTVEKLLTRILKLDGFHVLATKEYMSRVRGGANSTEIRVSSKPVKNYVERIDILIPLDRDSMLRLHRRASDTITIIGDETYLGAKINEITHGKFINIPITAVSKELGSKIYANIVAVGVVCGILAINTDMARSYIEKTFSQKSPEVVSKNIAALENGYEMGSKYPISINRDESVKDDILINGAEAIALGAIEGGCDFIASYPMSPATAVLVSLSQKTRMFDIIAEQAEDEIAAINMAIGAWYAGARAMITTSGGGFTLMTEGLSLAGMTETPVVLHLAQRPGPATGLPTRTEQGDLNLALYAGHGNFPRIILAPATIEDGFFFMQKAFNLADKYQVPVFLLSDQYYVDTYYNIPALKLEGLENVRHVIETGPDYKRYEMTDSGISPRGIPSHGDGLVRCDSDEHDESGFITEDFEVRTSMVHKRKKKLDAIGADSIKPRFSGESAYQTLVIGWGSTFHAIDEALTEIANASIAHLHITQLFPLSDVVKEYLRKAKKIVVVEGNVDGQLANLLEGTLKVNVDKRILKYNGEPFSVEDLVVRLKEVA